MAPQKAAVSGFPLTQARTTTWKNHRVVCLPDSQLSAHPAPSNERIIPRLTMTQDPLTHGHLARFAEKAGRDYFYYDAATGMVTVQDAHPLRALLRGASLQTTGQQPEPDAFDLLVKEYGEVSLQMFSARGFLSVGPGTVFQLPESARTPPPPDAPLTDAVRRFVAAYCFHLGARLATAAEWGYAKLLLGNELPSSIPPTDCRVREIDAIAGAVHCVFPDDPLDVLGLYPLVLQYEPEEADFLAAPDNLFSPATDAVPPTHRRLHNFNNSLWAALMACGMDGGRLLTSSAKTPHVIVNSQNSTDAYVQNEAAAAQAGITDCVHYYWGSNS